MNARHRQSLARCTLALLVLCISATSAKAVPLWAGFFGAEDFVNTGPALGPVPNPNDPGGAFNGGNYQPVVHNSSTTAGNLVDLSYSAARGWGFEVTNPGATGLGGWAQFGPFDDSANARNVFDDHLPNEVYDSFIGFKSHPSTCSNATVGVGNVCAPTIAPSGGVFRIDVPNGAYRFVAAVGSADNPHAHRLLVEDGGTGGPTNIGNHVVLVHNYDQAEHGTAVFARVGFDNVLPPEPTAPGTLPQFRNMDANGMLAGGTGFGPADSPVLNVTQGYLRVHMLQANSNDGAASTRDPNGADLVLFEAHAATIIPEPSSWVLGLLALGFLALARFRGRRR